MASLLPAAALGLGPLYKEVKRRITQSLVSGEWRPGQAIPSESRLAERYRVSIGTLRKAIDELVAEQILVRQQGRGTFVATHSEDRTLFYFFHVVGRDAGREFPTVELLSFARGAADAESARTLGIAKGARVLLIRNLLRLAGEPIIVDDIVIPQARFLGLTESVFRERESTIYGLYQSRYGISVIRARERLRAGLADRACARLLGIAAGTPVLEIHRVAYTYHDVPVELRFSRVNTARHDYLSELGRAEK